jgi:hypothetical protein
LYIIKIFNTILSYYITNFIFHIIITNNKLFVLI